MPKKDSKNQECLIYIIEEIRNIFYRKYIQDSSALFPESFRLYHSGRSSDLLHLRESFPLESISLS